MSLTKWLHDLNRIAAGQRIKTIRMTTHAERTEQYWFNDGLVIELENGVTLLTMQDAEGNGAGWLTVGLPE
jgi:hypothetical protein